MLINGLLFGLISSLHCLGMCGPLAMAIPRQVNGNPVGFAILYQIGRIGVYIGIGLLVFYVGISFSVFRLQQTFSLVLGSLLVLYVLWTNLKLPLPQKWNAFYSRFLNTVSGALRSGRKSSALGLGVVNGLLPCGAIYIAALYTSTFSRPVDAVIYMGLFGIGTMPVFVAAWFLVLGKVNVQVSKLKILYRFLPLLIGILMVLRGADLGIPYLSPEMSQNNEKTEVKNCCKH